MDHDRDIVRRVRQGEREAFSILVEKYKKPILNLIYRYTGQREQAEDLAQEVFLRAFRGLDGFRGNSRFFTWLYRIAVNLSLRHRERGSKFFFSSLDQKREDMGETLRDEAPEPQDYLEQDELRRVVKEAVSSLPDDQRQVVILYRYENMKYDQIAEVLDISLSAVKSRLHRARRSLKKALEPYVKNTRGEKENEVQSGTG